MKETLNGIFKIFSHLAREIQVYIFSGFIILVNVFYIDKYYVGYINDIEINYFSTFVMIITAYILGQISLAFYSLILELTRLDIVLDMIFFSRRFKEKSADEKTIPNKAQIFIKNEKMYFHFIERNVNLSIMRWNYSAAFSINSIINFVSYHHFKNNIELLYLGWLSIFVSFCLMLLHIYTYKENADQIAKLNSKLS